MRSALRFHLEAMLELEGKRRRKRRLTGSDGLDSLGVDSSGEDGSSSGSISSGLVGLASDILNETVTGQKAENEERR